MVQQATLLQLQGRKYSIRAIFWVVAILLGLLQGLANPYSLSTEDALSYLDISTAYLRGDWNAAINANWSPLYSWLLAAVFAVFKPSPYWEFAAMKFVNFLMYLFSLLCFEFFLREFIYYYEQKLKNENSSKYLIVPRWAWLCLGYTLFLWSSLKWLGIACDTPDMSTSGFFYLAAGIVLRVFTQQASWLNFIMLGVVLGFGYLSKSVMFPLAFVFLAVALFSVGNIRRALPKVLVALAIFTVIVAPFITAISTAKGRLTIGESGRLSYAWYVNPIARDHHWQGEEPGSGTPKHPTRTIFDNVSVEDVKTTGSSTNSFGYDPSRQLFDSLPIRAFEFATPIGGTYPVWYDPTYWNEGLKSKFSLIRLIRLVARNLIFYTEKFLGCLVFGYLIVICLGGTVSTSIKDIITGWRLLIPALAGLVMVMLVTHIPGMGFDLQPSTRYIAPFAVLLFVGVFSSVHFPDSQKSKKVIGSLTIATLVLIGGQLAFYGAQDVGKILSRPEHISWQVAQYINQSGIQPEEKVAILGQKQYFWARLARVKIVAEIPNAINFWAADDAVKSDVLKAVEGTGARVIVNKIGRNIEKFTPSNDWKKIGNTDYYAYFFRSN
jgi:hypothetical protein